MVNAKQHGGQGHGTSGFALVFGEADIISGTYSETLQARIDKLTRVIEAIPSALIIADAQSNIEYVNPKFTQITGYEYLEVVGKPVGMLDSHGAPVDEHRRGRDIAAADGSWHGEFCGRGKRGATYWSQRSICALRDADGLITNYVIYDEDIAPLRALEARLRRSQKMEAIGLLAAGLAHEFNNLLLAMLGFTALLKAKLDDSSETHGYSTMIESLAQKGAHLSRRLLTLARESPLDAQPTDLNAAVTEMLQLLSQTLPENISTHAHLQSDLDPVLGDKGQLQQVIMNLCLNAVDAMPEGGQLTVATRSTDLAQDPRQGGVVLGTGRYVQLSVTDTGEGIEGDLKSRIFEPFFTTKDVVKGTGLGLSVVLGIVKDHSGFIEVHSTLGHGSSFVVHIPVWVQPAEADPEGR
jgi:PAS domain S-box-containing protein